MINLKKSVWTDIVTLPKFSSLDKDVKTDVLIIGGGLCGILCAYQLKNAGIDYILVEGSKIASGITKNTTAKITSQHGIIYSKIIDSFGKEKAKMYLDINELALSTYKEICKDIECDLEEKDAYTYSLNDRAKIEDEVAALNSLGFNAEFREKTELPFSISGAIKFNNQAQFNPLKFIGEVAKDLNIYENSFIKELKPGCAITSSGKIYAKKIIVATHFPFINKHGSYFLKLYQHRSYVSVYENAVSLNGMYVDENKKGMSFRNYQNFLLIGGGGHRTGKEGGAWKPIHSFAQEHYPDAKLQFEWATQDCMTLDSVPYIGNYSKSTTNIYVATGFNKWGMTSSMAASIILCDLIQEKNNEYAEVFSPSRSILKPQLIVNGFESLANLIPPAKRRCPHLGCGLKWNKAEHTWDCPCHGSRFDKYGHLIDNPATGDL